MIQNLRFEFRINSPSLGLPCQTLAQEQTSLLFPNAPQAHCCTSREFVFHLCKSYTQAPQQHLLAPEGCVLANLLLQEYTYQQNILPSGRWSRKEACTGPGLGLGPLEQEMSVLDTWRIVQKRYYKLQVDTSVWPCKLLVA